MFLLFCLSEVIDEEPIVEVMREEVDEALKLAEEWELKYKVMHSFIKVEKRPNSPFFP